MVTYLLFITYLQLFTYSALPLYIPVCDCNQAKTRGILDINKPYYSGKGLTDIFHKPRVTTNYTHITQQRPTVTWNGWSCQQRVKSKKIIGSFWMKPSHRKPILYNKFYSIANRGRQMVRHS